MQSLKLNFKSQLYNWYDFFIQVSVFIPLYIYIYWKYDMKGAIILNIFLLIQFSFTLYLHIRYYLLNKGEEYIIYNDKIILKKNGKEEIFYATR